MKHNLLSWNLINHFAHRANSPGVPYALIAHVLSSRMVCVCWTSEHFSYHGSSARFLQGGVSFMHDLWSWEFFGWSIDRRRKDEIEAEVSFRGCYPSSTNHQKYTCNFNWPFSHKILTAKPSWDVLGVVPILFCWRKPRLNFHVNPAYCLLRCPTPEPRPLKP